MRLALPCIVFWVVLPLTLEGVMRAASENIARSGRRSGHPRQTLFKVLRQAGWTRVASGGLITALLLSILVPIMAAQPTTDPAEAKFLAELRASICSQTGQLPLDDENPARNGPSNCCILCHFPAPPAADLVQLPMAYPAAGSIEAIHPVHETAFSPQFAQRPSAPRAPPAYSV